MRWHVLALRLLDHFTDDRFKLEQLHLRLRKFFSARAVLIDPHPPQSLLKHPNPQLRVLYSPRRDLRCCVASSASSLDTNGRRIV